MVIGPHYTLPPIISAPPSGPPSDKASGADSPATGPTPVSMAHDLQFSVDAQTGKTVVRVVDPQTDQVIRQIPDAELLAIAHSLSRTAGTLIRERG